MSFRVVLGLIVVALVGWLGWLAIYGLTGTWITAGEVGLLYNARTGLDDSKVLTPQRIWVPPYYQLYKFPTKREAAMYVGADGVQVTTSDNANTTFDVVVWYHVEPNNVPQVVRSFGAQTSIEQIESLHIRRAAKEAIQAVGTKRDIYALMGPENEAAGKQLTKEMQTRLEKKGITVDLTVLGNSHLQPALQNKITSRVNSQTELTLAEIRNIAAGIERDIAVVQAEAESEANKIKSAQAGARSLEMQTLEADLAAVRKWNGRLPTFPPGATFFVPADAVSAAVAATGQQPVPTAPTPEEGQ